MKIDAETLEAIRPVPATLDRDWSDRTLSEILAAESVRRSSRPRRTARRRAAVAGLALAATAVSGVGVAAAATGLGSHSFADVFSSWKKWPGNDGADPATAVRAATAPGPQGTVFSVLSTGGEDQRGCRTAVFESASSSAGSIPSDFIGASSSFCSTESTFTDFGGVGVDFSDMGAVFTVSAGEAVRAEVRTPDGLEYPALLVGGDFWGWFPKAAHPTLVGYAADGAIVGRVKLY